METPMTGCAHSQHPRGEGGGGRDPNQPRAEGYGQDDPERGWGGGHYQRRGDHPWTDAGTVL